MAKIEGSEVCILLFTTIPPRTPTSNPQVLPSSSRGLIPAEITSMSTFSKSSPSNIIPVMASSPAIYCVDLLKWIPMFKASIFDCSISLAPLSNCLGINRGANSTTCGFNPKSRTAFAASSPKSPPPNTAASVAPFAFIFLA